MGKTSRNLCKKLLIAVCAALPAAVLNAADELQAQTKKELLPSVQVDTQGEVSCRYAGMSFPEATVIHGDRIPEQMCVRAPNLVGNGEKAGYHAEWIRFSKEARERSQQVVVLTDKNVPSFCQPTHETKQGECGCEGGADIAAGGMARSGKGAMLCNQGEWRPLVSCVAHDTEYDEGTVIGIGKDEQMCVRVLNLPFSRESHETHLDWVRTSRELRDRSNKSVFVNLNPLLCKPVPAKAAGLCGCEGFSDFGPKSIMPSASGPMRCEDGEWKLIPKDTVPK